MNSITFLGDVWLPRPFRSTVDFPGDFVFNLESPITTCDHPAHQKICLRASDNIESTFGRKPLAVCLANNHILDYGAEGYADTLQALRRSGIPYFGAGTLSENCNNPLLLKVKGRTIALLGYVCPSTTPVLAEGSRPGVMPISRKQIEADLLTARQMGAQLVILNLHWGDEAVSVPKPEDVDLARALIEKGADLIIGHHSHCMQSFEMHNSKGIFYSLGNCIFPNEWALQPSKDGFSRFRICFPKKSGLSLGVRFDLDTAQPNPFMLRFDGRELRREQRGASRLALPRMSPAKYTSYYRRHLHLDVALFRLACLTLRRRIPKLSSFKYGVRALARGMGLG